MNMYQLQCRLCFQASILFKPVLGVKIQPLDASMVWEALGSSGRPTVLRAEDRGDPLLLTMTAEELSSAAANGDRRTVQVLLEMGISPNEPNRFARAPLQVMMMGCAVVAELLLSGGADPNARDPSTGGTALHDAARGGFLDTVQTLVRYRADVSVRDNDGKLAADLARENGYVDVVTFLET